MKYCVFGLGAIGGELTARLHDAGADVCAIARGATLDAVRRDGLYFSVGREHIATSRRVNVTDDVRAIGPVDCVVVSVKSTAMPAIAAGVAALLGPDTVVVSAMNGVPWWFLDGLDGHRGAPPLDAVDPGGSLRTTLPPERTIGAVLHFNVAADAPGVVRHGGGNRIVLGTATGNTPQQLGVLHADLSAGGYEVERSTRIQDDVWFKLWGNMSLNPITALTGAPTDAVLDDPDVLQFVLGCMREAQEIGTRLGISIEQTPEERVAVTRKLGSAVPSMLQDVRGDRPLELDALVGAVLELGERTGVPTPTIRSLMGLARVFARSRGLYPDS